MRPSAKLWTTPAAVLREEEEGGKEVVVGVFCHQRPDTRQTREELFARPACKRKFLLAATSWRSFHGVRGASGEGFSRSDSFPFFFSSLFFCSFCERKSQFKWFFSVY